MSGVCLRGGEDLYLTIRRFDITLSGVMKRATVYFEEDLHKALKLKAVESETTLSDIVNEAIRHTIQEDLDDLQDIESRKGEGEVSYEVFLKQLKKRGQI